MSAKMSKNSQGERFNEILDVIKQLHDDKRHDYGNDDIFANFRLSEMAGISPWKGSVIRMGDKYARISNFIKKGDFKFKEESIKDTLMDMAIYSLITIILYEEEMFNDHVKQFEENMKLNSIEEVIPELEFNCSVCKKPSIFDKEITYVGKVGSTQVQLCDSLF